MTFLLDTNVVSEPRKPRPNNEVMAWLKQRASDELYVSALTMGELAYGVELRARRDPVAGRSFGNWLTAIRAGYDDRILPVTEEIAGIWGRLRALRPLPAVDGLLAATALAHRLILVTRNVRDFEGLRVPLENPWQSTAD